jgi:putative transposase
MNFKFIKNNHSRFTVKKMCQNLSVSESGYYRWLKVPVSNRAKINAILTCRIVELYEEHNGMVGSPMLTADLRAESKFASVSQKRVARLMKTKGLQCKYVKKFKTTTDSNHKVSISIEK